MRSQVTWAVWLRWRRTFLHIHRIAGRQADSDGSLPGTDSLPPPHGRAGLIIRAATGSSVQTILSAGGAWIDEARPLPSTMGPHSMRESRLRLPRVEMLSTNSILDAD